jgi:hypothetical protein
MLPLSAAKGPGGEGSKRAAAEVWMARSLKKNLASKEALNKGLLGCASL